MSNKKELSILAGILLLNYFLLVFVQNILHPIHFYPQNLLALGLIGQVVYIPKELLIVLNAGNIVLMYLISKQLFINRFALISPLIYAFSPWISYLVAAGSFYIYLSLLLLLIFYCLLLIRFAQKRWILILLGVTTVALYSSIFMIVILPIIFAIAFIFKLVSLNNLKLIFIPLTILAIPLLVTVSVRLPTFKNIVTSEIKIFQDPGLLNMVNSYQGAAKQKGFGQLAKLSENRYLFSSEYILLKFIKQFAPSTFFTPQEKLLNFSFTPPIFFGFLLPFIYGLYLILKSPVSRKALLLSTLLVVPSVLAKQIVDLNRLVIFAPVVILIISYGLITISNLENKKAAQLLLVATLSLVVFQIVVTLSDIQIREKDRFIQYFGQNYEIGKQ